MNAPATGLKVRDEGTGPALVMLHGIGGSSATFDPQYDELGDRLRLIAWDAPGYGESEDPAAPLSMDDYADRVAALIEERCGAGGAHVLGMSWGGVIATRLALRRPDLIRGLVLGSSTVGSGATEAGAAAIRERAAEMAADPKKFAAARAARLVGEGASKKDVDAAAAAMLANGGDLLVEVLREAGVDTVFGIVSVHNLPLVEAVAKHLRFVPVWHEAGAVNAADGYARATGGLGCALTSTGTGAGNAAGSLVESLAADTSVLHITGQVQVQYLGSGRGFIHETKDQWACSRPSRRTPRRSPTRRRRGRSCATASAGR